MDGSGLCRLFSVAAVCFAVGGGSGQCRRRVGERERGQEHRRQFRRHAPPVSTASGVYRQRGLLCFPALLWLYYALWPSPQAPTYWATLDRFVSVGKPSPCACTRPFPRRADACGDTRESCVPQVAQARSRASGVGLVFLGVCTSCVNLSCMKHWQDGLDLLCSEWRIDHALLLW